MNLYLVSLGDIGRCGVEMLGVVLRVGEERCKTRSHVRKVSLPH